MAALSSAEPALAGGQLGHERGQNSAIRLKAFYVDVIVPLESNIEKDAKVVALKAFYVDVIVPLESNIEKDAKVVAGQLEVPVTYAEETVNGTLVVPGCSAPNLCGRHMVQAFQLTGEPGLNMDDVNDAMPRRFHPRDASIVFNVMREIPKRLVPRGTLRGTPSAVAVVCCAAAAAGFRDYWDAPGRFSGC
ncbi:hypothetical protein MRX96_041297 [Rhipicephalus microplus]